MSKKKLDYSILQGFVCDNLVNLTMMILTLSVTISYVELYNTILNYIYLTSKLKG